MRSKTRKAIFVVSLTVLAVYFISISSSLAGKGRFTNSDVRGDYGFVLDGESVTGFLVGPIAGSGQINFDGAGNAVAVRTLNINGDFVLRQTAVGEYQVNPDGTGSSEFVVTTVDPPGLPDTVETFDFVLVDSTKGIRFIGTSPGVVASGSGTRQ